MKLQKAYIPQHMTAKLPESDVLKGRNLSDSKILAKRYRVICLINATPYEVIDCRVWTGRSKSANTVYASIWVMPPNLLQEVSGFGMARGYGYDTESEAIGHAIENAGISLYGSAYDRHSPLDTAKCDICGRGDDAVRNALAAIAIAAGCDEIYFL